MPRRGKQGPADAPAPSTARRATPVPKQAPAVAAFRPESPPPLGSVNVDSLSGRALKEYARRAGVSARDVEGLTEDRLRQNTKILIAEHFELLE